MRATRTPLPALATSDLILPPRGSAREIIRAVLRVWESSRWLGEDLPYLDATNNGRPCLILCRDSELAGRRWVGELQYVRGEDETGGEHVGTKRCSAMLIIKYRCWRCRSASCHASQMHGSSVLGCHLGCRSERLLSLHFPSWLPLPCPFLEYYLSLLIDHHISCLFPFHISYILPYISCLSTSTPFLRDGREDVPPSTVPTCMAVPTTTQELELINRIVRLLAFPLSVPLHHTSSRPGANHYLHFSHASSAIEQKIEEEFGSLLSPVSYLRAIYTSLDLDGGWRSRFKSRSLYD